MKTRAQKIGAVIAGLLLSGAVASTTMASQRSQRSWDRGIRHGYGANLHGLAYQLEEESQALRYRLEQPGYGYSSRNNRGYGSRSNRGYRSRSIRNAAKDARRFSRRAATFRQRVSRGTNYRRLERELEKLHGDFYRLERWQDRLRGRRGVRRSLNRIEHLIDQIDNRGSRTTHRRR